MVVGCVPSVTLLQLSVVQHAVVTPLTVPWVHEAAYDWDIVVVVPEIVVIFYIFIQFTFSF